MTLREILHHLQGLSDSTLDSPLTIKLLTKDESGRLIDWKSDIENVSITKEDIFAGSAGILPESDLLYELRQQRVEFENGILEESDLETIEDYVCYLPKGRIVLRAETVELPQSNPDIPHFRVERE